MLNRSILLANEGEHLFGRLKNGPWRRSLQFGGRVHSETPWPSPNIRDPLGEHVYRDSLGAFLRSGYGSKESDANGESHENSSNATHSLPLKPA